MLGSKAQLILFPFHSGLPFQTPAALRQTRGTFTFQPLRFRHCALSFSAFHLCLPPCPQQNSPLATFRPCLAACDHDDFERNPILPDPRSVKEGAARQTAIAYQFTSGKSSMKSSAFVGSSAMARSVLVAVCFLLIGFLAPSPKPASAPATEFSALRALEHNKEIARVPHPMGTPANDKVRADIIRTLTEMGVEVQEQPSRHQHRGTIEVLTNVIGRIPGTANTKAFTLMAHYDSVPFGPGAADDGAGVVSLLETARALKAGPPLKNDIIFVFTDGEEDRGEGAQAFMRSPWADKVGLVLNFEARGTSGPSLMFETSPGNGWLIPEAAKAGVDLRACSLMYSVYSRMPFGSDFGAAKRRGLKGFNVAFIDDFCWYHTKNDTPEHLSLASVQNHGSYALGLARHFGNLRLDGELAKPDVVYFNTLGSRMVYYPMAWSAPIAWAAAVVFLCMVILGILRGRMSFLGFLGGILAFALTAVASMLLTLVALALVYGPQKLYTQYTTGILNLPDLVAMNHNTLYGWAFAALVLGVFMACYQGLCRRARPAGLAAGALAWWVVVLAVVQHLMPGGSYIAAWPLLFASLGLAVSFLWRADPAAPALRVFLLGAFAVPGLILVAPAYQVLLTTVLIMMAPGLALLMALILGLLIPQVPLMTSPNRWWLPVSASGVAVLMLAWGAATSGYTAERPKLNCLAYGLDFDTGRAAWFSYDKHLDEWTSAFFPPGHSKPPCGTIAEFIASDNREYWKAPAPVASYAGPQATLVKDSSGPKARTVTVHVSAPDRPRFVKIRLISDNAVHSASVFGQNVEGGGKDWSMDFRGFPAEGADVTFEVEPVAPLAFKVVAELLGLPSLPGMPARPGYMAVEPNTIRRPWSFRSDEVYLARTFEFPAGTNARASAQ
jgi:hypothetical protein